MRAREAAGTEGVPDFDHEAKGRANGLASMPLTIHDFFYPFAGHPDRSNVRL
jgi:hypothetical protein